MKLLTIAIPCYNSEDYIRRAADSALAAGPDAEILIVDDGSNDRTRAIAREYEAKYPDCVRAVHQDNLGHGGAVNTALREAQGVFFKVCDSDDWLNRGALISVMHTLQGIVRGAQALDAMLCNYVYEKEGARKKRIMRYEGFFPEDRIFTWQEVERDLPPSKYVLMHSLIYRTELLRECGLDLPEHTFYVDNLVVFQPMIHVKTLYYLNVPLYRYYIGRADQSVNEKVMIGRIDQQLRVTRMMIDQYRPDLVKQKHQMEFLVHYMGIMMTVSTILLLRKNTPESIRERDALWMYLKRKDKKLFHQIRYGFLGRMMNMPGRTGRSFAVRGYRLVQRFYGFN